jgi:hypothetical protein
MEISLGNFQINSLNKFSEEMSQQGSPARVNEAKEDRPDY